MRRPGSNARPPVLPRAASDRPDSTSRGAPLIDRRPAVLLPRSLTLAAAATAVVAAILGAAEPGPPAREGREEDYRSPPEPVVRLLTATPPPQPMVHAPSGNVALVYEQAVLRLARVARPYLGLAGYRFDPQARISGIDPLATRVELVRARDPVVRPPVVWQPRDGALLAYLHFSPDGRTLSAIAVSDGPPELVLFDVESGRERRLDVPVNPAWGDPCTWTAEGLLCRVAALDPPPLPPDGPVPTLVEHLGGPAPTRTYSNLLDNAREDALFEHYFTVELARVDRDGRTRRVPGLRGLIASVDASPDGRLAVVTRIERPFSRVVPARRFPSVVEVWQLEDGRRLYASEPLGFGLAAEDAENEDPRRFAWSPGTPTTLGWIEAIGTATEDSQRPERWLALSAPFTDGPREVARSDTRIDSFGWTTANTPYFSTTGASDTEVRIHVVLEDGVKEIWRGSTTDRYGNPGRALRVDGSEGAVIESDGAVYLSSDGLGPDGPRPFLDRFDLRSRHTERMFTAEPDVYEEVLAVLDPDGPVLVTSRETETEPPNLFVLRGEERTALRPLPTPYPDLVGVTRRPVSYARADGVALAGTLYTPAGWSPGDAPLPTLVWIYPYEFSDREHAEQLDVRLFRFHQVKGPSPLAALLEGYAVLVNPTVPILLDVGSAGEDYLNQLVASVEAAVDHLTATGVTDPKRVAVGGRSYGAFSSANLVIHSKRFAAAVAMSGAYNRTLTPFGFQHEKRSFWQATEFYTSISPFFHANQVSAPILLVHGGADENPGTPLLQSRRFFHALLGEGKPSRYVELPGEGHHYWARENVLLAAAEMIDWLGRTIGPERTGAAP
jgi:dipeptidyl aminopeptidase/acylaminoacyl peptidase